MENVIKSDLMIANEEQEIRKVINAYFYALKTGNERYFERAFRSDSVVISAGEKDPEKIVTPIDEFVKRVLKRHEDGTRLEEIPLGITISYVGRVANVRVDFKLIIGEKILYGTDYFNLIKKDGEWKISQKIYDVIKQE
jgi:hypothetical protein